MAGKISFFRRMRKITGYAGRYLFPCPFSAGLSPLFSSALVTSFPSSPRTVIFFRPDQPLSLLSGNRRFFLLYRQLSLVRHRFDCSLCLSSAHFYLTFSPPRRIPPACTIFAFPLFLSLLSSYLYRPSLARRYQSPSAYLVSCFFPFRFP